MNVIDITPINFPLNKVTGSEFLTDDQWCYPWDGGKLADYAETLLVAYDEWRRQTAPDPKMAAKAENLIGWRRSRDELRASIRELTMAGESMVDVPALLGLTFDEMWAALRNSRPPAYEHWSDLDWLKYEAALATFPDGIVVSYVLARRLGLQGDAARSDHTPLGNLAEKLYGRRKVSSAEMKKLVKSQAA